MSSYNEQVASSLAHGAVRRLLHEAFQANLNPTIADIAAQLGVPVEHLAVQVTRIGEAKYDTDVTYDRPASVFGANMTYGLRIQIVPTSSATNHTRNLLKYGSAMLTYDI